MENNDAVIFVVDSCDRERFAEARDEIHDIMQDDRLRNAVLLVLANKQDLPHAATPAELTDRLNLTAIKGHYYMTYYIELLCNNFHYQSVKTITDWLYPCSNEITDWEILNKHS